MNNVNYSTLACKTAEQMRILVHSLPSQNSDALWRNIVEAINAAGMLKLLSTSVAVSNIDLPILNVAITPRLKKLGYKTDIHMGDYNSIYDISWNE